MRAMTGAELLRKVGEAWHTADGTVRRWEHVLSAHIASVAWEARLDDEPDDEGHPDRPPVGWPEETEVVLRVRQDRLRGLKRFQLVSAVGDRPPFDDLVMHGATWWARMFTDVTTNDGDESEQIAGSECDALLFSGHVLDYFQLSEPEGEVVVVGRRALRVRATERPGLDTIELMDAHAVFGLMPGGEEFVLDIDVTTGILLRAVKLVHGREAEILEWTSLSLDLPLDEDTFTPPSATSAS